MKKNLKVGIDQEIKDIQAKLLGLGSKAMSDRKRLELDTEKEWEEKKVLKNTAEKKADELFSLAEEIFSQ